ncbi:MAG: DUF6249 domain-containing protein [Bacteroidota bacterium]
MDFGPGIVLSLACLTAGLTVYFLVKANHTERMAKIERGLLDGDQPDRHRSYYEIKLGMLLVGLGMGLLLAMSVEKMTALDHDVLYPALMFVFGGLSLIGSYFLVDRLRNRA